MLEQLGDAELAEDQRHAVVGEGDDVGSPEALPDRTKDPADERVGRSHAAPEHGRDPEEVCGHVDLVQVDEDQPDVVGDAVDLGTSSSPRRTLDESRYDHGRPFAVQASKMLGEPERLRRRHRLVQREVEPVDRLERHVAHAQVREAPRSGERSRQRRSTSAA